MFPMIEWTLSIGQLGQAIATLVAVVWLFAITRSDIRSIQQNLLYLEQKQQSLTESFTQLGNILTKVAVQDTRLSMIDKSIDELRHGQGYIKQ